MRRGKRVRIIVPMPAKRSAAIRLLDNVIAEPETLGRLLLVHREGEEWTQAVMAKKLGISVTHLSDIENGRRLVSPERAARFAVKLGAASGELRGTGASRRAAESAGLRMGVEAE